MTFHLYGTSNNENKTPIKSIITDPHKFLGSFITPNNTPQDYFSQLKTALESKLDNINKAKCRGEFKLAVYERYPLPSMRYHLSIHTLHKTHLDILDMLEK